MSINHEKYTLVIVDEYSRYTWVHFLKKKSQAPEMIMSFIRMVENQNDVKVKQIRTDNGTEFRNHELESFCDEKGISQNFSSPYTPEQNGVAKRKNRTLIEAARTMLNGSVLSKHFWTEAVRIACYTQNRSIIVKRHDKTPYEIFRERIHDISYFHVFRCPSLTQEDNKLRRLNTLEDEIGIDDSSIYAPDEFIHEDDPSRQYQTDSDISYYVIPHGRSLSKLMQENHVPKVIAPNEPDIPLTEDTEGPPDRINTKGNHEQNVQNEQIITQPTEFSSCTSTHSTPPQVEHQKINSTNVLGIPSTGVKGASVASRSKPRSNTKKDRTLPAKSALKQVEAHSRMNKSNEKHKNRIDSSISYKRTVINSNSNTSCKTCNKCLIFVNHDQCVVRSEMCVKQSSATKVWRVKQVKQVWKATGKLFTTIGHQWRPTGRLLPLGDQWPLTRNTPPKVLPTKQWKPTGRLLPLGRQCPLVRSTALKSDCLPADPQETIAPVAYNLACTNQPDPNCNWGSNVSKSPFSPLFKCRNFMKKFIGTVRFGNDHFGAIMGYGDYVIGDNVISKVYYVEGLGHNLFSVGQFFDSDLEVDFRKHTYMMRSYPICLLSKASKNKSWLWHRRLNHLNFGTLNDVARKDLVRGLPRLKFKKDHLCSACQLGKSRKTTHKPKMINTIMEVLHTFHMDLCEQLRVKSINGKKYILVIVDDYSRFTWVKFLRSKDETPAFIINLLKQLQVGLNKTVWFVRTDNGIEFVNKDLTYHYESVGITHEKTVLRTPQ
ncbi:retrovirus-related pol polyprotein from transposon TNT 1-94 [Tanacetum coccineum]